MPTIDRFFNLERGDKKEDERAFTDVDDDASYARVLVWNRMSLAFTIKVSWNGFKLQESKTKPSSRVGKSGKETSSGQSSMNSIERRRNMLSLLHSDLATSSLAEAIP